MGLRQWEIAVCKADTSIGSQVPQGALIVSLYIFSHSLLGTTWLISHCARPVSIFRFSHLHSRESPDCPSLRASDEHILIVRVLRARRMVRRLSSHPSEAARSASTKGSLGRPRFFPLRVSTGRCSGLRGRHRGYRSRQSF